MSSVVSFERVDVGEIGHPVERCVDVPGRERQLQGRRRDALRLADLRGSHDAVERPGDRDHLIGDATDVLGLGGQRQLGTAVDLPVLGARGDLAGVETVEGSLPGIGQVPGGAGGTARILRNAGRHRDDLAVCVRARLLCGDGVRNRLVARRRIGRAARTAAEVRCRHHHDDREGRHGARGHHPAPGAEPRRLPALRPLRAATAAAGETRGGALVEAVGPALVRRLPLVAEKYGQLGQHCIVWGDRASPESAVDGLEIGGDLRVQRTLRFTRSHRTPSSICRLHGEAWSRRWWR